MLIKLIILIIAIILIKKYVLPGLWDKMVDDAGGITPEMRAAENADRAYAEKQRNKPYNPEYTPRDADQLAAERAARKADTK